MTYSPKFVTKQGIRDYFEPTLTTDDLSDTSLITRIEMVERMIMSVYDPPTNERVKEAAKLLIVSMILKEDVGDKYKSIAKEKLGDRSITYDEEEVTTPQGLNRLGKKILSREVSEDKQPFMIRKV